jgi:hypothetical protein
MRPLTEPEREPIGSSARVAEVARTHAELTTLLTDKPPLWPATAFASVMIQRREAVIARLRDVQLGFTDPTGLDLARETTKFMLLIRLQTLVRISEQMGALVATPTFQTMFGESDDEADADVIVLAANRFMDYHDEILQLAEENLGMTASAYDDLYRLQILIGKDLVRLLAAFVDFIDGLIARLAKLEEALRYGSFRVEDDPVIFSFRADDELLQAVKAL